MPSFCRRELRGSLLTETSCPIVGPSPYGIGAGVIGVGGEFRHQSPTVIEINDLATIAVDAGPDGRAQVGRGHGKSSGRDQARFVSLEVHELIPRSPSVPILLSVEPCSYASPGTRYMTLNLLTIQPDDHRDDERQDAKDNHRHADYRQMPLSWPSTGAGDGRRRDFYGDHLDHHIRVGKVVVAQFGQVEIVVRDGQFDRSARKRDLAVD